MDGINPRANIKETHIKQIVRFLAVKSSKDVLEDNAVKAVGKLIIMVFYIFKKYISFSLYLPHQDPDNRINLTRTQLR